jgi:DNA-binding transcriptional LysR family regulator
LTAEERGEVTGLLRVNPLRRVVLDVALIPILATLARQHPRRTVEINADQTLADIVAQGFDAGIGLRRAIPARHGHDGTALVPDSMLALSLALAGVGIAYVAEPLARRYLREGSLKWLQPQSATEYTDYFSIIRSARP